MPLPPADTESSARGHEVVRTVCEGAGRVADAAQLDASVWAAVTIDTLTSQL